MNYRLSFNIFKDADSSSYPYLGDLGIYSVTSRNSGITQTFGLKSKLFFDDFSMTLSPQYRNLTMFKRDEWEYNDRIVKKRRVDHAIAIEFEPGWTPIENLTLSLFYSLEKNFSTLETKDYSDENYIRHNIRLFLNYNF